MTSSVYEYEMMNCVVLNLQVWEKMITQQDTGKFPLKKERSISLHIYE